MELKFKQEWLDRLMDCPMTGKLINTTFLSEKEKEIWYSKPGLKHMFENDISENKYTEGSNSNIDGESNKNESPDVDLGDSGSDDE